MSAYQTFANLPAALADFAAGLCRRHVRIDGHVIDLVQAAAEASRVREEPAAPDAWSEERWHMADRATWDDVVSRNVRAELARASAPVELPPLAEPALPAPPPDDASAYRCPRCSRPWDGAP